MIKAEVRQLIEQHVSTGIEQSAGGASGVDRLRAQLDETNELYNKLYAEHKAVQADVHYLKQMMLNVQSSHTETNRTMMKLLHASSEKSRPHENHTAFQSLTAVDKVAAISKMNAIKDLQQKNKEEAQGKTKDVESAALETKKTLEKDDDGKRRKRRKRRERARRFHGMACDVAEVESTEGVEEIEKRVEGDEGVDVPEEEERGVTERAAEETADTGECDDHEDQKVGEDDPRAKGEKNEMD